MLPIIAKRIHTLIFYDLSATHFIKCVHDYDEMMMPSVNVTQNEKRYALDSVANLHPSLGVFFVCEAYALREFGI